MKELTLCDIVHPNAASLDQEDFAMLRRNGIGASDSSAILGAMAKFRTESDVLENKLATTYTEEEKEISQKPNVRKGRDLEPLILRKASEVLETQLWKPTEMFRLKQFPHLTINYDGLMLDEENNLIPVEAKFVTTFGDKYYDFNKTEEPKLSVDTGSFLSDAETIAAWHGIPPYYFIQVQQQMLGVDAQYAYLAALRDRNWLLYVFRIPRYDFIQNWIISDTYKFWNKVTRLKTT